MTELIDGRTYSGTHGSKSRVYTGVLLPKGQAPFEYPGERTLRDEDGIWYVVESTLKPAFRKGDLVTGIGAGTGLIRTGLFDRHVENGESVVGPYRVLTATLKSGESVPPEKPEPEDGESERVRVLREAERIVTRDRNSSYGEPEDNFQRIADYWNVWLQDRLKDGEKISQGDTAAMMILVKMAREMNAPNEDNKIDGAGYFACWAQVDKNTEESK